MNRIPVAPVLTDDATLREARSAKLRDYVRQRFQEQYCSRHPDLRIEVYGARRSDYDEVKVLLTKEELLNDAEGFAQSLQDEMAAEGIATFLYVRLFINDRANAHVLRRAPQRGLFL
jgi:hypothetical protein